MVNENWKAVARYRRDGISAGYSSASKNSGFAFTDHLGIRSRYSGQEATRGATVNCLGAFDGFVALKVAEEQIIRKLQYDMLTFAHEGMKRFSFGAFSFRATSSVFEVLDRPPRFSTLPLFLRDRDSSRNYWDGCLEQIGY